MRFAHTVVSNTGFRDPAHNPHRLAVLRELLTRLAAERVEFVAIPAGYLTVRSEEEVTAAVADIADVVEACGVAVVGGVDVEYSAHAKQSPDSDELVSEGRLPYFGFAAFPTAVSAEVPVWRQASTSSSNADLAPAEALPGWDRIVMVGGRAVVPLVCGELFNWRAREKLAGFGPGLVLDLGHSGMGQALIPAMTSIANAVGCPVAHTQHTWDGSLHFVSADGDQQSVPSHGQPGVGDATFWIAWCVREV